MYMHNMIPMHVHAHIVYDTRHSVAAHFGDKDYSICDILSDITMN